MWHDDLQGAGSGNLRNKSGSIPRCMIVAGRVWYVNNVAVCVERDWERDTIVAIVVQWSLMISGGRSSRNIRLTVMDRLPKLFSKETGLGQVTVLPRVTRQIRYNRGYVWQWECLHMRE